MQKATANIDQSMCKASQYVQLQTEESDRPIQLAFQLIASQDLLKI